MQANLISIVLFIFNFIGCGGDNHGSNDVGYVAQPLTPVKSLAEITNDLSKVTMDSWDAVADERDSLGKIALDLENSLAKPMGGFASRAVLLQKNLIILFQRDMDAKNREIIINKTLEDTKQLKDEIDEAILVTPENKISNLRFLNGLSEVVEVIHDRAEEINKHKNGFISNREEFIENTKHLAQSKIELTQNNKELAQYNKELAQRNIELAQRNKELRFKLDLARSSKLLHELINNINQETEQ